jgi:hypothetical protein
MNTIYTNNLAYQILAKQKTAPYDLLYKYTAKRKLKTIQVEIKRELCTPQRGSTTSNKLVCLTS